MDTKVNYVGITRRVVAGVVDQTIYYLIFGLLLLLVLNKPPHADLYNADTFDAVFSYTTFMSVQDTVLGALMFVVLEVLMITKLGWTPGKFLCGICIKDANKIENATLMQAVIRSSFKLFLWIPSYISEWFLILPILVLIPAIFDQRKQLFYDKIAKTVVIDYKPEECHSNLNYVGITRRIIACIIDNFIIVAISLIFFLPITTLNPALYTKLLLAYSILVPSIALRVFMTKRFSGTPGQLLCGINIKDANTLENVTLTQAAIRYVFFEAIQVIVFIVGENFYDHINEQQSEFLSTSVFISIVLFFIFAVFDKRKQFFYDKIARTVAIDYKPTS